VKSASGSFLANGCRRPDGPTKPATSSFDFMGLMEEPQAADSQTIFKNLTFEDRGNLENPNHRHRTSAVANSNP